MFKIVLCSILTVCLLWTAAPARGQSTGQPIGSVVAPMLSYVLDASGGLHPLAGIPGSAFVGPVLSLNLQVSQAAVAPSNDYILANTSNGLVVLRNLSNSLTLQTINGFSSSINNRLAACNGIGALSPEDRKLSICDAAPSSPTVPVINEMVLSSTGSAAAVYSGSEGRVYALGNLSQTPTVTGIFDVRTMEMLSAFGISDDGKSLSVGTSTGALYMLAAGQTQPIGTITHPSAIRFLSNSNNFIVADDVDNKIYMVSNGQLFAIGTGDNGISVPVAVALSNDNQRVFVGNSQPGSVTTLYVSGGLAQSTICQCTLTGLYPTNTDSVFRLTDFSGGPVSLFDGSAAQPRILFAPAGPQF